MATNRRLLALFRPTRRIKTGLWAAKRRISNFRDRSVSHRLVHLRSQKQWPICLRVWEPKQRHPEMPAVLVVPGLGQSGRYFEQWSAPFHLAELAQAGIIATAIDLSGRGDSWGVDDFGGPYHQSDVTAALSELLTWDQISPERLGVISHSLGCTAVATALAAETSPPVSWWMDIEGPSDRGIITAGGRLMEPADGHGMHDEAYWAPREAFRWVGKTGVGYLRVQGQVDHAQPGEFRHAMSMLAAAKEGNLPWFRLNDHPINTIPTSPTWLSSSKSELNQWVCDQIKQLHQD